MRWLVTLAVALVVAGCGGKPEAKFDSETEELSYLSELSNPTPDQWRRRNVLQEKADLESSRLAREAEHERRAEAAKMRERELSESLDRELASFMKIADADVKKEDWVSASIYYHAVVVRFPDTPEAKRAAEEEKRCDAKAAEIEKREGNSKRLYENATEEERRGQRHIAAVIYGQIARDFPHSKYADKAREGLRRCEQ